ncbi:transcriptional repressor [Agitococcus lubricus]|uniref:Fur family zinc uptake transcriptional regulator n=1 Tax=Agitococcus lubricus TaxID=1077255 RepID=A0A2T5J442_9GAMM|nr:transcriptional repressor [Agitococcus lubricus]PTQ91385.1 Fur family zinc uptake transcriptional regulator [Agitococcus lubricus]
MFTVVDVLYYYIISVVLPIMTPDVFHHHQHEQCIHSALEAAERLCADRNVRLTAIRKRVLELVWASHQPLGAYAILDRLTEEGHKPAPPTVYRALDFLLEQGLVHRIASLNAYLGCTHPQQQHLACFFLCQQCGNAEEMTDSHTLQQEINRHAAHVGFSIRQPVLELTGVCQHCLQATTP